MYVGSIGLALPIDRLPSGSPPLIATDIIPLGYWVRTRLGSLVSVGCLVYLLSTFGYLGVLLAYRGVRLLGASLPGVWFLVAIWVAYLAIHELGYFVNDFWSQPREHARGLNLSKPLSPRPHWRYLVGAVVTRLVVAGTLLAILYVELPGRAFEFLVLVVIGTFGVFLLHNSVFYPYRVATFFLLYLGRYLLVVPFVRDGLDSWVFATALVAPAVGFAITYAVRKRVFSLSLRWLDCGSCFILRGTAATLALGLFAGLTAGRGDLLLLVLLFAYCFALDFGFVFGRFFAAIACSLRMGDERWHVHTIFSPDCALDFATIQNEVRIQGLSRIYVTDHADSFSADKFRDLQNALAKVAAGSTCDLVPGLEYAVLSQHFLATNLREYLEVDPQEVMALERLRSGCDHVIWAHPSFSIRRVFTSGCYRRQLIQMMAAVDGLEWINVKSTRGYGYLWRHVALCLASTGLFGRKLLTVGLDAHTIDDWRDRPLVLRLSGVFSRLAPVRSNASAETPYKL